MDLAYDHIAEQSLPKDADNDKKPDKQASLEEDVQAAYQAFSNSPWGAKIGGFFGTVVKQGESVYREAGKELTAAQQDASRGFANLQQTIANRTRGLSLHASAPGEAGGSETTEKDGDAEGTTPTTNKDLSSEEALKESETVLSRFKAEAAKRLKDIQKAEDAADEALLKFGSNLRNFLKEAVKITPETDSADGQGSTVLFESKDASGKRVIHTSRFDAQLHVIHTTSESFTKDPVGGEFDKWDKDFNAESKTEDISNDLVKYPELRSTMEKLVPDTVAYADFWKRYYFLRHSIETAEARRRDLLKAASAEEEVGWDEDSDDEGPTKSAEKQPERPASTTSSTTVHSPAPAASSKGLLQPSESRKSNDEKSQADSDTSYDVVGATSGVPSQAPNSPKDSRKDESDEEDWE